MPLFTLNNRSKSKTDLRFRFSFELPGSFGNNTVSFLKDGFHWQVSPVSVIIESGALLIWLMLKRLKKNLGEPLKSWELVGRRAED